MRLQVSVHRYNLPPVHLVFNTASAPQPVSTVADFLGALNAVIPLESSDGEWGLEEYAVELAAREHQDNVYECLHFQLLGDVFKEDDEVVVRGLTTDEVRERRQGGRIQISSDGRRLLDGVAWGRRFRPLALRPDVIIPPRKRRRILVEGDDYINDEDGNMLQLEYPVFESPNGAWSGEPADADEDDTDGDYTDGEAQSDDHDDDDDDDDDDEVESDDETESPLLQTHISSRLQDSGQNHSRSITTFAAFDDTNSGDEDDSDTSLDDDEVQFLLAEAAKLDELEREQQTEPKTTKTLKRKRETAEQRRVSFEGFPSPKNDLGLRKVGKLGSYSVKAFANGGFNGSNDEDSDTTSESEEDSKSSNSDIDTSDDSSDSSTDDSDESDESSEDEESVEDDSSSASEDSSDESDGTGQSSEADTAVAKTPKKTSVQKPAADNPPGTGSLRTRKNNDRTKRRKRLDHLKSLGILPSNAGFEALNTYEASQAIDQASPSTRPSHNEDHHKISHALEAKRKELLARIHNIVEDSIDPMKSTALPAEASEVPGPPSTQTPAINQTIISGQSVSEASSDNTPLKRSRLNVESSRRLLFGSLGLRTPKTKAAEDELRDKLTEAARKNQKSSTRTQQADRPTRNDDDNSWKTKLIISAVECVQEGRILTPPPFPFKQQWEKIRNGNDRNRYSQSNEVVDDSLNYDDGEEEAIDEEITQKPKDADTSAAHGFTHAHNTSSCKDLPYPDDFDSLEDLSQQAIMPEMVIAYKELCMNSKFEPEESEYRVARVINVDTDLIEVELSKRDRREAMGSLRFNSDGNRVYHGLELPEEVSEEDDGSRELSFDNLIRPKLVKAANLQVPASVANSQTSSSALHDAHALVPESAPIQSVNDSGPNHVLVISNMPGSTDSDDLLQPIEYPSLQADSETSHLKANSNASPKDSLMASAMVTDDEKTRTAAYHIENVKGIGKPSTNGQEVQSSAMALNDNVVTTSHEDGLCEIPSSLKSIPSTQDGLPVETNPTPVTPLLESIHTDSIAMEQTPSQHLELSEFVDAPTQQEHSTNGHESDGNDIVSAPAGRPSSPKNVVAEDDNNNAKSQKTSPSTRSSQRIAQAKLDTSSPAARMMKSALAGMGGRKGLKARRKA